ncbi:hypothetical protein DFJ77DRAFT_455630 [Powellomyces hirtus]|nr:hypothetical protein DFJ77DRAFT_455630 [Powellomyces hirtus]
MRDPVLHALQHKLPFLPGYQFDLNKDRNNERKSHAFDYSNGVAVHKPAPGIGGKPLPGQQESKIHTSIELYPQSDNGAEGVPAWVAFDRKVLRFYAYFQEAVHERREEQYRVRKVNIYFYLEDDSVHVSEPKTANSGIPQGTLIRRHRICKQDNPNGQHYTVADFNVGKEVTFYSRTFKIVGCDQFTKDFLNTLHVRVPDNSGFPMDPYTAHRQELQSRMKATRPRPPQTSLKKFLENDRRVLRFYCIWDDTQSVFGDLRHMVVHYYLSDDTIEIREHIPANAGRDSNTLFLRRSKLPKRMPVWMYGHNSETDAKGEYFNERDFLIGAVLHLYGRPFVVCDCDDFTKEYYNGKYGIETFDPVRIEDYETRASPAPFSQSALAANYELLLPPSPLTPTTGKTATLPTNTIPMIGSGAPPRKDFQKLMLYDTTTLRFSAALNSSRQVDKDRRFVVSLYVADDTISVFEPKSRNTGLVGGKFLEKSRIRKPDGSGYYGTQDFYIGAELIFFHHPFILTSADDYAVKFMAEHPDMFPQQGQSPALAAENAGRKSPIPAPVLHQWQEDILAQGDPLPMTNPAGEVGDNVTHVIPTPPRSASGQRRSDPVMHSQNMLRALQGDEPGVQQFQSDGSNARIYAPLAQDMFIANRQSSDNIVGRNAYAPPAQDQGYITARQSSEKNTGPSWSTEPSAAAAAVLARLRDGSTGDEPVQQEPRVRFAVDQQQTATQVPAHRGDAKMFESTGNSNVQNRQQQSESVKERNDARSTQMQERPVVNIRNQPQMATPKPSVSFKTGDVNNAKASQGQGMPNLPALPARKVTA